VNAFAGAIGTRPRGSVTIGGDAAGIVVVVDDVVVVVVDEVLDVLVVVDATVVGGAVGIAAGRAAPDELHAAHAMTSSTHAVLRPRPRCTPS
jgi:hypothetical protein